MDRALYSYYDCKTPSAIKKKGYLQVLEITWRTWRPQSKFLRGDGEKESQQAWSSAFVGVKGWAQGFADSLLVNKKRKSGNLKPGKRKSKRPKWSVIKINQNLSKKEAWTMEGGGLGQDAYLRQPSRKWFEVDDSETKA